MSIADTIREAIRRSGKSANEIAKAAKVPQPTISRFLRGKTMTVDNAGKLASHLGLTLQRASRPEPVTNS